MQDKMGAPLSLSLPPPLSRSLALSLSVKCQQAPFAGYRLTINQSVCVISRSALQPTVSWPTGQEQPSNFVSITAHSQGASKQKQQQQQQQQQQQKETKIRLVCFQKDF